MIEISNEESLTKRIEALQADAPAALVWIVGGYDCGVVGSEEYFAVDDFG